MLVLWHLGPGTWWLKLFRGSWLDHPNHQDHQSSRGRAPGAGIRQVVKVIWCSGAQRCHLVFWCDGVLVYWCDGVLVCWCAGVLVCWCTGAPRHSVGELSVYQKSNRCRKVNLGRKLLIRRVFTEIAKSVALHSNIKLRFLHLKSLQCFDIKQKWSC